jgi:hypothetical protein
MIRTSSVSSAHILGIIGSMMIGEKKCGQTSNGCVRRRVCELKQHRKGGDELGSVIKKRRKKMRKHKHRKLLAKTRHQRRKGK